MTTSPGLRERKKARTRATIQREALKLFQQNGYAETSVDAIAAAAEVSPSTFFRYFPTKEDVVLTDFVDEKAIARFVAAPAQMSLTEAFSHAVTTWMDDLPEEDFALEHLRNQLIRDVPELRRGMLGELVRPIRLLAEAIGRRAGREVDEDVTMYAGAMVGAMLLAQGHEAVDDDPRAHLADLGARTLRLGRILVLPEPE